MIDQIINGPSFDQMIDGHGQSFDEAINGQSFDRRAVK
jgi:hypothetical protein